MQKIILDTDFLINILKNRIRLQDELSRILDDNYEVLLETLLAHNVFIVKHQFPINENIFAHSVITDRHSSSQPFVEDVLNHHKATGKKRITVDLDNTLISWCGRFKEVCDYALKYYPEKLSQWRVQ